MRFKASAYIAEMKQLIDLVQEKFRIKTEVRQLIEDRLETMRRDSDLAKLILQANRPSVGKKQAPR